MKIKDRIAGAYHALQGKSAVASPVEAAAAPPRRLFGMEDTEMSARQCWLMYKQNAVVAWTIDLICEKVAELNLDVHVNGQIVKGHLSEVILDAPGYNRTRRQLIREIARQILATGTGHVISYGKQDREPLALDVLHTRDRNIVTDYSDGWPSVYQFHEEGRALNFQRQPGRDPKYFASSQQELLTMHEGSGDCRGAGLSKLNGVRAEVELRYMGMLHNRSMLGKGASLSGNLHFKGNLTPEQMRHAQAQVQQVLSGYRNAGAIMVTAGGDGSEFKAMQMTAKDMDYAKLVQLVEEAVVARFGVPKTLYSVEAQTHNNYNTAWHMLYDNAVLPLFNVIYGELARHLSMRLGEDIEFRHNKLSSMVLRDKAIDGAAQLKRDQIITLNEARHEIGYEPVAGGDAIYDLPGLIPQYEDMYLEGEITNYLERSRQPSISDEVTPLKVVN